MEPQTAIINIVIRKLSWVIFGWLSKAFYNKAFDIYWERDPADREKVSSDWKRILKKSGNQPAPMYISAGDLFFMEPLLEEIKLKRESRTSISRLNIKRISEKIFFHLTRGDTIQPLISETLLDVFSSNIKKLEVRFGSNNVYMKEWENLPCFAGVIYRDYLMFHPWEVDFNGKLSHRGRIRFMSREYDPELFEQYKTILTSGFYDN